ncbi:type 4a pilus biogenesis protein PilO [bacterium]|nr:type 4a pilus biogenesis protein PilO [bacterium]
MVLSPKNKQTLLVGGVLGGAILLIVLYFGFMMVLPEANAQMAEAEKVKTARIKNEADLKKFRELINNVELRTQVNETFTRVSSRLPSEQDPIEVFGLLRSYFEGTDVQFTYLEPGRQTSRGRYFEYPFVIRGRARYHEFGQLVNLIECNPNRLMYVNSFRLTNDDRRPSIHPMEVGVSTFTFRSR